MRISDFMQTLLRVRFFPGLDSVGFCVFERESGG